MRPDLRPENPTEWLALRFNLAPRPVGEAMFGMPMARSIIAGVRLGIFERLAKGPAGADELARELELTPAGTRLLLDSLYALGHVERDGSRYELTKAARRWLDPASETYVGTFIEDCAQYWEWWSQLEEVVRTGKSFELHDTPPEDPAWQTYIRGQFELARLSAPEVAKALRLPDEPTALLDVAGGHGWFSAELCRRHPGLKATIVDLPGSAAVGRQIVAEHGMSDRVEHREGDAFEVDLGGPYDGALCFNLIHHLSPEQNVTLFRRIHDALKPGGTFAVLDLFTPKEGAQADASAFLGLFFYLTSGAATYSPDELAAWLARGGIREAAAGQDPSDTGPDAVRGAEARLGGRPGLLALRGGRLDQLLVADLLAGGAPVSVRHLANHGPDADALALVQAGGAQDGLVERVDEDALAPIRERPLGDGDLDAEARLATGAAADREHLGLDLVRVHPGDRAEELGVGRLLGREHLRRQLLEQLLAGVGGDGALRIGELEHRHGPNLLVGRSAGPGCRREHCPIAGRSPRNRAERRLALLSYPQPVLFPQLEQV